MPFVVTQASSVMMSSPSPTNGAQDLHENLLSIGDAAFPGLSNQTELNLMQASPNYLICMQINKYGTWVCPCDCHAGTLNDMAKAQQIICYSVNWKFTYRWKLIIQPQDVEITQMGLQRLLYSHITLEWVTDHAGCTFL